MQPASIPFGEVSVEVETYAEHSTGDLTGMTTYRIYAVLPAEGDFLSSISGEGQFSTQLRSTTSFYQHPLGAATPNNPNPILYGSFPELEYDSFVTIGLDQQPDAGAGEGAINVAGTWAPPSRTEGMWSSTETSVVLGSPSTVTATETLRPTAGCLWPS